MCCPHYFANADDLDSFVRNRQQVLNQFSMQTTCSRYLQPDRAPDCRDRPRQPVSSVPVIRTMQTNLSAARWGFWRNYRYGGTSGVRQVSTSGFMQYIQTLDGVEPPAHFQRTGKMVSAYRSELQLRAIMVFFRTMVAAESPTSALPSGNNRFIHAPSTGKRIEVTSPATNTGSPNTAFARRVKKRSVPFPQLSSQGKFNVEHA